MSIKKSAKNKIFIFLFLILAIIFPFLNLNLINLLIFTFFYSVFVAIFSNYKYGLFLLIIIRPFTEIITNFEIFKIGDRVLNFSYIIGVIIIIFGLLVINTNFQKIKKAPLLRPLLVFLTLILLSLLYSFNLKTSAIEFFRILSLSFLYLSAFILIKNKKDLAFLFIAIIVSSLVPNIFSYFQYITGTGFFIPFEGVTNRVYGTFTHPNLLAYYLVFPLVLIFSLFSLNSESNFTNDIFKKERQKKLLKIFLITFLILTIFPFIFTFTRGAWLVLILTIFLFGFFNKPGIKKITFSITFMILVLILFYVSGPIQNRISNISNQYTTIDWRIDHWANALSYAKDKIIIGYGAGTAEKVMLSRNFDIYAEETAVHNDYIKILLDNGLIGLITYLTIITLIFYNLYNIYKNVKLPQDKMLISLMIFLSFAIFLAAFYDNILKNTALQWIYWILLGSIFSIYQKQLGK